MSLHMIELRPDAVRLMEFLRGQGLLHDAQLGYGIHAWLKAAFGELAPKPWRLLWDQKRPARILGYAACDDEELKKRLLEFAEPLTAAVCSAEAIASKKMPVFASERRLGFELLACPVGRKAGGGKEKDLFLLKLDQRIEAHRDTVYCQWARERLERGGGVQVLSISVAGFRLVRQLRQTQENHRQRRPITRPEALLKGELRVVDSEGFARLLASGIGRHRAFGYGMILLKPPSL